MAIENEAVRTNGRRFSSGAFAVAVCILLLFFAVLAFVSFRYRAHVLAARSWNSTRADLWRSYSNMQTAARLHDGSAYASNLFVAMQQMDKLANISRRMNQKNAVRRQQLLDDAKGCMAPDIGEFAARQNMQSCADLLRFPH